MRRVIPAAILVLVFASCRGERAGADRKEAPTPAAAAQVAEATTQSGTASELTSVTENGGAITIAFTENGATQELRGELRDNGKRKYALGQGSTLYEIKPGDDQGFKLRNPDGSLRWKVKVSPEKIKVSDNEENKDPYELKSRPDHRVKVVGPGERELGNVRYAAETLEVETTSGKVIFSKKTATPSRAYAVLLLDAIPARERYILVAELLSRGQ